MTGDFKSSCSAGFLVLEKNACAKQLASQTVGLQTGFSIGTVRLWAGCITSLASIPKSETALRRACPCEVLASLCPSLKGPPAPTSHPPPDVQMLPQGAEAQCHTCQPHTLIHALTHTYLTHLSTTYILHSYTHSDIPHPHEGSHAHLTHLYTLVHIHTHIHSHISQIHPHTCSSQSGIHGLKLRPHPCSWKKQNLFSRAEGSVPNQ